jgi:hypothetical protein
LNVLCAEIERVLGELPAILPELAIVHLFVVAPVLEHGDARNVFEATLLNASDAFLVVVLPRPHVDDERVDSDIHGVVDDALEALGGLNGVLLQVDALRAKRGRRGGYVLRERGGGEEEKDDGEERGEVGVHGENSTKGHPISSK